MKLPLAVATPIVESPKDHLNHYALLRQAAGALWSLETPAAASRLVFELASTHLQLDTFLHFRWESGDGMLHLDSFAGLAPPHAERLRLLAMGEPPFGGVAKTRRRLVLDDAETSDQPAAAQLRGLGLRAYAGYPLLHRDRLMGTLAFGSRRRTAFDAAEVELLATLCQYVAMAGERSGLARVADRRAAERERALAEKDRLLKQTELLLKEMNHRVKNSLQMVVSLLDLQRRRVANEAALPLREAGVRVMALAQIHARLYQGSDVRHVEMDLHLRDLCDELQRAAGDGVRVMPQTAPIRLETDRAIPVALITTELVMNAFRHGFRDGRGTTTVALAEQGGFVTLTVADDGCGLPADFDPRRSEGLGMRIVNSLTRQLGGSLEVDSSPRGSLFRVLFPLGSRADSA